jgi:hypothetical protein
LGGVADDKKAGHRINVDAAEERTKSKRTADRRVASMRKLARKKATPKKTEVKMKVGAKNATDAKTAGTVKNQVRGKNRRVDTVTFVREGLRARSGEQSGDLQGLSNVQSADSESVDELLEQGNAFEAEVVTGVEDAEDADEREVRTHEVP